MSKSRNRNRRDFADDDGYYDNTSKYLDKKREKRLRRAMKTKDVNILLQQNDDELEEGSDADILVQK
jgi:hypothetical protein